MEMSVINFDFNSLAPKVEDALRHAFPGDGVSVSPGYAGRVHVKIVSNKFKSMSGAERQTYVYDVLKDSLGADSQGVSLVSVYSFDEL